MKFRRLPLIVVVLVASHPSAAMAEDLDAPDPDETTPSKAYQYDHEYFSIRFGGGVLIDYNAFYQDSESEDQLDWDPEIGIRDLRALASGRTPWQPLTYTVGYAYIQSSNEFRFRQTGFKLKVDALSGFFFLGRTKEGFSTNKLMVGYYGWFNERSTANDAFIPILADGVRWNGTALGGQLVYNIGAFADPLSKWESFNKNDWQVVARAVWLPLGGNSVDGVLHLAAEGRFAGADDDQLQYKSKPESFLAQSSAVDTGKFDADRSLMGGLEAYYVKGPLAAGTEYFVNKVSSGPAGDPFFHGGEIFASYMFTGETHPYKANTAVFEDVTPNETFFSGGPGAWELALRASYVDLDSGPIAGGKFFRFTSLVNWYMTNALRLEAAYGYGVLDRFDQVGGTHFIQTRVQLQFK